MSWKPQRGQGTERRVGDSTSGTGPVVRAGAAPGGAMPCSASLRRPSGVIQSLVHGGSRTVRISTRA